MDLSKRIITNSKGQTISVLVATPIDDSEDITKSEGVKPKSKYGTGKHQQQVTISRNGKTFTQMRTVGVKDQPHVEKHPAKHGKTNGKTAEPKRHTEHAENTEDEKLKLYVKNPKGEKHLKNIAKNELRHRKHKEKVKAHLDKHVKGIKKWHSKQVDFYTSGQTTPDSKGRKDLAGVIKAKAKGIVVGVKHEVKEIKEVGSALRKLFTGKHKEITHHEKKAMKQFGTHMAMVVGSMIYSHSSGAGHGGEAEAGGIAALAGLGKGLAMHYLEHSGIMRAGHALLFAKGEEDVEGGLEDQEPDYENMSDDDLIMEVIKKIAQHIQSGTISEQDWINIGEEAAKDRDEDTYDENPFDGEEPKDEKPKPKKQELNKNKNK